MFKKILLILLTLITTIKPAQMDIDPNEYLDNMQNTKLILAAQEGCVDCVRALIDANADVNHINTAGFTALMFACMGEKLDHLQIVKILVDKNAIVDKCDRMGNTALYYSLKYANQKQNFMPIAVYILDILLSKKNYSLEILRNDYQKAHALSSVSLRNYTRFLRIIEYKIKQYEKDHIVIRTAQEEKELAENQD